MSNIPLHFIQDVGMKPFIVPPLQRQVKIAFPHIIRWPRLAAFVQQSAIAPSHEQLARSRLDPVPQGLAV